MIVVFLFYFFLVAEGDCEFNLNMWIRDCIWESLSPRLLIVFAAVESVSCWVVICE